MYRLTEEGREYLKDSLPEKKLLKFIGNEKPMQEVAKFPKSQIAVGWAKKNGWIIIDKGIVKVTDAGSKAIGTKNTTEEALEKIDKNENVNEDIVRVLLSRNLIEEAKAEPKKERGPSIWRIALS